MTIDQKIDELVANAPDHVPEPFRRGPGGPEFPIIALDEAHDRVRRALLASDLPKSSHDGLFASFRSIFDRKPLHVTYHGEVIRVTAGKVGGGDFGFTLVYENGRKQTHGFGIAKSQGLSQ